MIRKIFIFSWITVLVPVFAAWASLPEMTGGINLDAELVGREPFGPTYAVYAVNKYVYITVNKKFDDRIRASYSVTEIVDNVEEFKHVLIR